MKTYPMTPAGHKSLSDEHERLTKIERPRIIEAIATAREFGDLKENAEYHAAKDEQGQIEARIRLIEQKLSQCQIIDTSKLENDGRVIFGTKVTITNMENDKTSEYHIVGEDEADLSLGKISSSSPIAQGLMGKFEGDVAVIATPDGSCEFSIDEVIY